MAHHKAGRAVLVQNGVNQDVAGIGGRVVIAKILDGFTQQAAVFAGAGHLDPLLGKGVGILEKGFQKPLAVRATGSDVIGNLQGRPAVPRVWVVAHYRGFSGQ